MPNEGPEAQIIRVMVADRHEVVRKGVLYTFSGQDGLVVVGEAGSGAVVLQSLRDGLAFDVLVLGLIFPDMNGLEVLKQALAIQPKLRVLIFSANDEEQYALRCLRAGAAGYVSKESSLPTLVEAVLRIAAGGRYVSHALLDRLTAKLHESDSALPHEQLSDREFQVLCMIAGGKSVSQVAEELSLSVKSISTYRSRILHKLGLVTTNDLIRYAILHRLVE